MTHFLFLFRGLLPSWKFFENSGDLPRLYYRVAGPDEEFQDWKPALDKPKRNWSGLFINANVNYILACDTILRLLILEISKDNLEGTTAFQMVKNLCRYEILRKEKSMTQYQFKIAMESCSDNSFDEILISAIYEV
jgi:hypothetical protein